MMNNSRKMMCMSGAMPIAGAQQRSRFFQLAAPTMRAFSDDMGPADMGGADTPVDAGSQQPSYIKEMKTNRDWQDALENRERPVLIQAGASWCGPCNILKP